MNLGDGLKFELENGKPKLVVASCDESKSWSKVGQYQVPQRTKTQKSTAHVKHSLKEPEKPQRDRKVDHPVEKGTVLIRKKTKVRVNKEHSDVIGVGRVRSESKTKTTDDSSKVTEKMVKESLVCLTQEQLQQILTTIKASGKNEQDETSTDFNNGEVPAATKEDGSSSEAMCSGAPELLFDSSNHRHRNSQGKGNSEKNRTPADSSASGLFGTLGERERERDALEAKRAQWRRELDEQMALKKQQKVNTEVVPQSEPPAGHRSNDHPVEVQDERTTDNKHSRPAASQTHSNQKTLPSATRSAFVLGEATPQDHAFSEEKKEQQRRWLLDLEQQREEALLRRRLEKQIQNQTEDHERWAMHFDSFQRRLPLQPPTVSASDRREPEVISSLSNHRSPSGALSTAWEAMSTCGGDSMGRASVDTTQGFQQKSSYLRTMTALLDPAQIEERERKRIKQLEHQRAIEAQVEERRRQKEKENAVRQALEQEEERRVARERELLQQQFLNDTERQRQKEEFKSRKSEELYLSIQRAQEEAQKDRQLQRIRELAKKGHDVSNLLKSLECESISHAQRGQSAGCVAERGTAQRVDTSHTTRKDTAVQTDVSEVSPPVNNFTVTTSHHHQTPAVPGEYKSPPNVKRSRRDARLAERNGGKENVFMALREADPYEAYARTDRPSAQQPARKPEWNTQKPSKPFIPASERYPQGLQRHRQESRMRRQMELMTLVERNTFSRTPQQDPPPDAVASTQRNVREGVDSQRRPPTATTQRGQSPPIPALRHRLQQVPQSLAPEREEPPASSEEWPPSSDYVPYVRTDEVYHLDPLAPISRPTTHQAPSRTHADVNGSTQPPPAVQRDPLLHPELLKSTERQQAILKGLSELRQGLLQKQRELESCFNPVLQGHSRNPSPAFQPL
ncbi:coiled-coil domain-containing protein 66 isoform X2 [Hoplias malabaricus]|uniref:coiled-coil domain-containing protein 66 isoform X2 n=1 Tax=Hoplias malabaricus TaxID=27720 RepID=UPI0034621613